MRIILSVTVLSFKWARMYSRVASRIFPSGSLFTFTSSTNSLNHFLCRVIWRVPSTASRIVLVTSALSFKLACIYLRVASRIFPSGSLLTFCHGI